MDSISAFGLFIDVVSCDIRARGTLMTTKLGLIILSSRLSGVGSQELLLGVASIGAIIGLADVQVRRSRGSERLRQGQEAFLRMLEVPCWLQLPPRIGSGICTNLFGAVLPIPAEPDSVT